MILYRRDYITSLFHFSCKIIDRHSCFFCTNFHCNDSILYQSCICTNLAFTLTFHAFFIQFICH